MLLARTVKGNYVKSYRSIVTERVCAQIVAAGTAQAALLVHVDGGNGGGEMTEFAKPDFDENNGLTVQHDEVDFTMPAAEIPLEEVESVAQQVIECQLFGTTRYGLFV
jgi:hypothetical protein